MGKTRIKKTCFLFFSTSFQNYNQKAKMCYFFKKFVDSRVDLAKLFIVNEGGGGGREAGLTSSLVILGISGLTCIICYYKRERTN